MFLFNILYCSPLWLQSLEPCSISEYSFLGADLAKPIKKNTEYIIVVTSNVEKKSPPAPLENTLPNVPNGFVTDVPNVSINTSKLKLPSSPARCLL